MHSINVYNVVSWNSVIYRYKSRYINRKYIDNIEYECLTYFDRLTYISIYKLIKIYGMNTNHCLWIVY